MLGLHQKAGKVLPYLSQVVGYALKVMRQSACLVLTQLRLTTMLPSLLALLWVEYQTMTVPTYSNFSWFETELFHLLLGPSSFILWLSFTSNFQWASVVRILRDLNFPHNTLYLTSLRLCFSMVIFVIKIIYSKQF